jgi:hypothetical protein
MVALATCDLRRQARCGPWIYHTATRVGSIRKPTEGQEDGFATRLSEIVPVPPEAECFEVWSQDEARVGQERRTGYLVAARRIGPGLAPGAHAVALMDKAVWHIAREPVVPANITPVFLPPFSTELNPSRIESL